MTIDCGILLKMTLPSYEYPNNLVHIIFLISALSLFAYCLHVLVAAHTDKKVIGNLFACTRAHTTKHTRRIGFFSYRFSLFRWERKF